MNHPRTVRRPRPGFGIIEVLVASVIIGFMVVAALNAAGMSVKTQRLNAGRLTVGSIAQDLVTEVLAMPYEDPQNPGGAIGVDSGESASTRSTFDDVDDYHAWGATDAKARDGTTRTGYANWTLSVAVAYADVTTGAALGSTDTGLKRITVTVTSPEGASAEIVALRHKEGALEQSLPVAGTAVSWLGVELRVGASSTRSQFAAAPLANLSTDN